MLIPSKIKLAIIGLGKQNLQDHLPVVLENDSVKLDSICDLNEDILLDLGNKYNIPCYTSLDALLAERKIDVAIVAVPHFQYLEIINKLAAKKVHIFKEKPLAGNLEEALKIHQIVEKSGVKMMVAVQRKFNPIFQKFEDYKRQIGKIYSIHGHYTLNIERLDVGWRASKSMAGGGVVLDMGYHLIDLLIWYFGLPDSITAKLGYNNRDNQDYDVEDTAKIIFDYAEENSKHKILGSLLISRIYPMKEEQLTVYGTRGSVEIKKNQISLLTLEKEVVESLISNNPKQALKNQIEHFISWIREDQPLPYSYLDHLKHVSFIEACYLSDNLNNTQYPKEYLTSQIN